MAKLKAEGVSDGEDWAYFLTAYDDKATADYAANTLRMSVQACDARGGALPADTPKLP
jgi:hypothetical protein